MTELFRKDRIYKIERAREKDLPPLFYTGYVIEENDMFIVVRTTRDEELIISKQNLTQAVLVEDNGE